MHAGEISLIILLNCFLIFVLYFYQKRLIEKNIKNLKKEIHELEDLVAAIIEEFEDIADSPKNSEKPAEIAGQFDPFAGMSPQELKLNYPTVGDFLDNMEENELPGMVPAMENSTGPFGNEIPALEITNLETGFSPENDENDKTVEEIGEISREQENSQTLTTNSHDTEECNPGGVSIGASIHTGAPGTKPETGLQLESINDPRHRRILELRQQGVSIEDIARQLETGRGEIHLVLGLYRRS